MGNTLFEKYGGIATISTIIQSFYHDVMAEPDLRDYFARVNMPALIDHQVKFFAQLLGGPAHYDGRSLRVAHQGLGITFDGFEKVAQILKANLEDAGMEGPDIEQVMATVDAVRDDIVDEG